MNLLANKRIRPWAALAAVVVIIAAVALLINDRRSAERNDTQQAGGSSLLALTWGPSLCRAEPSIRACRTGRVDRHGQSFLLHGLWPQPSTAQYCDNRRVPALPTDLTKRLQSMMSDATAMTAHEWSAHGTCSGVSAVDYFTVAAALTEQATAVLDPIFRDARGSTITSRTLRERFASRFGAAAGERIMLSCRRTEGAAEIAYEVRLSLPSVTQLRDEGAVPSLRDALEAAPGVQPGCGRARVP